MDKNLPNLGEKQTCTSQQGVTPDLREKVSVSFLIESIMDLIPTMLLTSCTEYCYVTISCPTMLHNISFHWYKIRIEDFICLHIKALTEAHWLPKLLSYFQSKSVILGEPLPEACGHLFSLFNQLSTMHGCISIVELLQFTTIHSFWASLGKALF